MEIFTSAPIMKKSLQKAKKKKNQQPATQFEFIKSQTPFAHANTLLIFHKKGKH